MASEADEKLMLFDRLLDQAERGNAGQILVAKATAKAIRKLLDEARAESDEHKRQRDAAHRHAETARNERDHAGCLANYWQDQHAAAIGQRDAAMAALREADRFSLVIESAVRNADAGNHEGIVAMLKRVRAALDAASKPGRQEQKNVRPRLAARKIRV